MNENAALVSMFIYEEVSIEKQYIDFFYFHSASAYFYFILTKAEIQSKEFSADNKFFIKKTKVVFF